MSGRTGSHQLSNGLVVSDRPERPSPGVDSPEPLSRRPSASLPNNRSGPNSGPKAMNSAPKNRMSSSSSFSGPMTPIQPTGLITSSTLDSSSSTPSAPGSFRKACSYGPAVTSLVEEDGKVGFRVSRMAMWVMFLVALVLALIIGVLLMVSTKKPVILLALAAVLAPAAVILVWNYVIRERGVVRFLDNFPQAELRDAVDGQYIKIKGVVTCGSIPLETSFSREHRCIYVSSELYEYRGCGGKPANNKHHYFSWGQRYSEKYVADFYISDCQSGLRALVKAGYGAKVAPLVKPTVVVDVTRENNELSLDFLNWQSERGMSSDGNAMRLEEGHIKEGTTLSVMGMVRRQDNVLMIVPPREPISTGCQFSCCLLPSYIEGIILMQGDSQNEDAVSV